MDRRKTFSLLVGFSAAACMGGVSSAQHSVDTANAQWVEKVLEQMKRIKPGMRRADLLEIFTTEGGLSTGLQRTFVSQHCPYFKVDVTFHAVGRANQDAEGRVTLVEGDQDQILSISRPYLEFSVMD